jgi:hypothetical protein
MINNKNAFKIFMTLTKEQRRKLRNVYQIESIDNYENKSWQNRFGLSFWNWLWMNHFKKVKHKYADIINELNWKAKRFAAIKKLSKRKGWDRWDDSHPFFEMWFAILASKATTLKQFKEEQNVNKNV